MKLILTVLALAAAIANAQAITDAAAFEKLKTLRGTWDGPEMPGMGKLRTSYRTIAAASAREALDLLGSEKDIVLVFSDIVMPGNMDGIQLARSVRERHPNVPVLLTSGYARMAEAAAGQSGAAVRRPSRPRAYRPGQ